MNPSLRLLSPVGAVGLAVAALSLSTPAFGVDLFWSGRVDDGDREGVFVRDLSGGGEDRVLAHVEGQVGAIAIDEPKRTLYWTTRDGASRESEIWRADLDGDGAERFWTSPDAIPALALDSVHGFLYAGTSDGLRRFDLDTGEIEPLSREIWTGQVAVDPERGALFWIAPAPVEPGRYGPPSVWRSNLFGEDPELVVRPQSLTGDLGLALDTRAGKVYWAAVDYAECSLVERISRANYDGRDAEVVFCGGPTLDDFPSEIAVDPNSSRVFWQNSEITPVFAVDFAGARNVEVFRVGSLRSMVVGPPEPGLEFLRGDANGDGAVQLADALRILGWLFQGSAIPPCLAAADSNADASINLSDATFVLYHLFLGREALPPPFPACGGSTRGGDVELGCAAPGC